MRLGQVQGEGGVRCLTTNPSPEHQLWSKPCCSQQPKTSITNAHIVPNQSRSDPSSSSSSSSSSSPSALPGGSGEMMKLHISPSLRTVTVLPGKGVRDFTGIRLGTKRVSYKMVFYLLLVVPFLLRVVFVMTAMGTIDDDDCSSLGCMGKILGPRIWKGRPDTTGLQEIYQILEEEHNLDPQEVSEASKSLEEFVLELKSNRYDAKTFAIKLKAMVSSLEQRTRSAKIQEYLYRHVASSSIPKHLHCLTLTLTDAYSSTAAARLQLPPASLVPSLTSNSLHHFVLASDNVLAASVVAASLVRNSLRPDQVVLHVITDRKTFAAMHAWFALHPLDPAVVEIKGLHHFDWFARGRVPVMEAMERDAKVRSEFRGGSSAIVASTTEKPYVVAAKLQALSPKYNSVMNHIRINLPELFPSLKKVVFLDDDIVIQADLSPLWDIDLEGNVNGAVATCHGSDKFVMSKRFKSYLNFSHPLIVQSFDPEECAWAYGMNIFDLDAWRKTNISKTYHYWLKQNLKSDLSLWQLGTLPPGLIAFHGHVQIIDPYWHMLGLGYQENTSMADVSKAAVIHFNGRAKPWLDIAFPELRALWSKYIDFSDKSITSCHIRP